MLPVGALCFYQAHFGRTVLPKWPFWAHLFYPVFYSVSEFGRACFRQARVARAMLPPGALFRARAFAFLPCAPKSHLHPLPHSGPSELRRSKNLLCVVHLLSHSDLLSRRAFCRHHFPGNYRHSSSHCEGFHSAVNLGGVVKILRRSNFQRVSNAALANAALVLSSKIWKNIQDGGQRRKTDPKSLGLSAAVRE